MPLYEGSDNTVVANGVEDLIKDEEIIDATVTVTVKLDGVNVTGAVDLPIPYDPDLKKYWVNIPYTVAFVAGKVYEVCLKVVKSGMQLATQDFVLCEKRSGKKNA